jgi:hypothetical protein
MPAIPICSRTRPVVKLFCAMVLFAASMSALAQSAPAGSFYHTVKLFRTNGVEASPALPGPHVFPIPAGAVVRALASSQQFEQHASAVMVFPPALGGVSARLSATGSSTAVQVDLIVDRNAPPGQRWVSVQYPAGPSGLFTFEVLPEVRIDGFRAGQVGAAGSWCDHWGCLPPGSPGRYTFPDCRPQTQRVPFGLNGRNLNSPDLELKCEACSQGPMQLSWETLGAGSEDLAGNMTIQPGHLGRSFVWAAKHRRDVHDLRVSTVGLTVQLKPECGSGTSEPRPTNRN